MPRTASRLIQENCLSLQWFRSWSRLTLLVLVLLVGSLGTDLMTVDRVDTQELEVEAVAATPPALDLSSPFAHTELDPPLVAGARAPAEPHLLLAVRPLAPDVPPLRYPDRTHPPPRA